MFFLIYIFYMIIFTFIALNLGKLEESLMKWDKIESTSKSEFAKCSIDFDTP